MPSSRLSAVIALPVLAAVTVLPALTPLPAQAQAPVAVIGGESAPVGQEIGRLGPMLVTSRHVLVFDQGDRRFRIYDLDGNLVLAVGRAGSGPGEYRAVYGMTRDSSGHVYLLDAANGRITTYIEGDSLRLLNTRSIEFNGYGLCTAGDKLFVSGYQDTGIVHEVDIGASGARIVRSFGEPALPGPLGQNQMIRDRMGYNPIACVPGKPVVMLGSRDMGVIQILRTDVQDQRTVELPGFERMVITPSERSLTFGMPESGHYDMLVDIQPAPAGVIATVHRVTGPADTTVEYRRYFISPTGAVHLLGSSQSRQVGAEREKVYCAAEDPYPEIAVFVRGTCP